MGSAWLQILPVYIHYRILHRVIWVHWYLIVGYAWLYSMLLKLKNRNEPDTNSINVYDEAFKVFKKIEDGERARISDDTVLSILRNH